MKTKLIVAGSLAVTALAWAAKDPIIMTVNGVDVPKSEFEYLYHKNSQQQLDPRPLEDYVEMFTLYKLKVADARANGIDTTAAFRQEMAQYASELAAPYLNDSTYLNSLVKEAIDRMQTEAEANHIMIYKGDGVAAKRANRAKADSLRTAIINGTADFADVALQYSTDNASKNRGGSMGYMASGRFPYNFETAVFTTADGAIAPLVESPYGYHIVKGGKKRKAQGSVLARHILLAAPLNGDSTIDARAHARIDSVYAALQADPESFDRLARELSDDKRSGAEGGMLPWFETGDMIPEFSEAAFTLKDGEISTPVRSVIGYHIIQRLESRPVANGADVRPALLSRITNPQDERHQKLIDNQTARFAKRYKASLNKPVVEAMRADAYNLGLDSLFFAKYEADPQVLLNIAKQPVAVSDFIADIRTRRFSPFTEPEILFDQAVNNFYNRRLTTYAEQQLEKEVPEYHNLLNEYREGSMLYEISLQRVWDKAGRDRQGLDEFFNNHRSDYSWTDPHVKGYLIQAANDSVADMVRTRLGQVPSDSIVITFRKEFTPKQAQIERVLATKGQNSMVDNIVFGGEPVIPSNSAYTTYFLYDFKLINEPEELNDVRALVTNDYQTWLEQQWIAELKEKYPVVLYPKVIKKVK